VFPYFTIKFHFYFSLLFAYFCFKFFASLCCSNFCFEAKRSEAKFKSIFLLFFTFFRFFSLRFNLVIFASKRNEGKNFFASKEAKFNIFCIISLPNFVSGEKKHFYQYFCLIFVSLRFFRSIIACFTIVLALDFWCFATK
jgi:hypothetical protein